MNLRDIKKDIEYYIGEFIDDCLLFAALNPDKNGEGVDKLVGEAIDLYNDLKEKISCVPDATPAEERVKKDGKLAPKSATELKTRADKDARSKKINAYYDGIFEEMLEKLDTLSEDLSAVVSAE